MSALHAFSPSIAISPLQRLGLRDPMWHLRPRKRTSLLARLTLAVGIASCLTIAASAYTLAGLLDDGSPRPTFKFALDTLTRTIFDPPTAWTIEGPANAPLIAIDAGHGGKDAGATRDSHLEKDMALAVSLELRKALLEQGGVRVVLTRADDSTSTPASRAAALAKLQPDAVISLHLDSFPDPAISGPSVFIRPPHHDHNAAASNALARTMLGRLYTVKQGPLNNPGKERLAILRVPHAANILVELGYITNPADRARLADPVARQPYVAALAEGIDHHLRARGAQRVAANIVSAPTKPAS